MEIMQGADYEQAVADCHKEIKCRISEAVEECAPIIGTPEGRLLFEEQLYGILINSLIYMQNHSRTARKKRQREGIDAAREKGVHFGRKKRFDAVENIDVFRRLESGEIDRETAEAEVGACKTTFSKMRRELKTKGLI